jgi:exopolyphosphatase/guanosine-5'-triphosphate,3'-diphosphate pyrophosphatase
MARKPTTAAANPMPAARGRPVAVVDIGATGIRMTVAHIDAEGGVHTVDSLEQAAGIGKDTFTKGYIGKSTIEECVTTFKSFRRILDEYGIQDEDDVRVVATSAVREAANRDAFIDRISIATGFYIETIDDTEIARLTYQSIRSVMQAHPALDDEDHLLIVEVGGGTIEVLCLDKGNVSFSQSYRIGSLRLREMLEAFGAPVTSRRNILESNIQRTIEQIYQTIPDAKKMTMLAMGGDILFAARQIAPGAVAAGPVRLPIKGLAAFAEKVLSRSVNELVRKYRLTFPEAETAGPALLAYLHFARTFKRREILVTDISLRHGLLIEKAAHGAWVDMFKEQIIRSALEIGAKYRNDEAHGTHVAGLCDIFFEALTDEHRLKPWNGVLLHVAALMHDMGLYVSTRSHHKHSQYLIQNSEIFGLSRREILLVALTARYHRKAPPKPEHEEYAALDRDGRMAVTKLSAILRMADALDRSHSQRVQVVSCGLESGGFVVTVDTIDDLALEQMAIRAKGPMFEDVYGMKMVLRQKGRSAA